MFKPIHSHCKTHETKVENGFEV